MFFHKVEMAFHIVHCFLFPFYLVLSTIKRLFRKCKIHIAEFDRLWKTRRDPLDPDDIYAVNTKNMTIDLAPVIREEIIMAFHNENM